MNISLVQADILWEDKRGNFGILENLITPLFNRTDIIILPEMFNTGFSMNPDVLGEAQEGETLNWMNTTARKGNFGVCGSYIVREGTNCYNRWIFVSPDGSFRHYNKRHLFTMGSENKHLTPGREKIVFSFRDVKISPFICYDLRFPVWSRSNDEVDLIIYSSNWPTARKEVWDTLTKARAIENQCYVAAVNRIGTDGNKVAHCGESRIIHPYGNVIVTAGPDSECVITGEISANELKDFRRKFPVLKDADKFTLHL